VTPRSPVKVFSNSSLFFVFLTLEYLVIQASHLEILFVIKTSILFSNTLYLYDTFFSGEFSWPPRSYLYLNYNVQHKNILVMSDVPHKIYLLNDKIKLQNSQVNN
jgi:hypothetical protein